MSEEKKPAVIVVSEANGRQARYALTDFGELRNGELVIGRRLNTDVKADDREIEVDVMYAPGQWTRVHKEGAAANDGPADKRKLAIALEALREIAALPDAAAGVAPGRAEAYLADIADVDL